MGQAPEWTTRRADACSQPRRSPRADWLGDGFVPGTYQLRAERTGSRGPLSGFTGFSPMSGPLGFGPNGGELFYGNSGSDQPEVKPYCTRCM